MKRITLLILKLYIAVLCYSQTSQCAYMWTKTLGGDDLDNGASITTDASGNVYITGSFRDTVNFDPGAGTDSIISNGWDDVFVQKLDASGNLQWTKTFGGKYFDEGNSIITDASGNVYITGFFEDTVDFDPGAGTDKRIANGFWKDVFVQKLDASGKFIWVKTFGGDDTDEGFSINTDASGNVYVTGYFRDTVDFDPGAGTDSIISNGKSDVFVQKLDPSGNFLWAKTYGGDFFDEGVYVTTDVSGNVYVTGSFWHTVDFDPGAGIDTITSKGWESAFVQKLDESGNFLWAKTLWGYGSDCGNSLTTDASGNVYITGFFEDTVDFDPGPGTVNHTSNGGQDAFVQKLDPSGNFLWARTFGGSDYDKSNSITADDSENLYITGNFQDTVDFDPGAGTFNHTSNGYQDVFVQKLDSSGNFLWVNTFGGDYIDLGNSITTDASGNVYITGNFRDTVDFNPGAETEYYISKGITDIFITKFIPCTSTSSVIDVMVCDSGSYVSPSGRYIWTSSGIYYDIISNVTGCDSIITISLTIHNNTENTINPVACGTYTSPSDKYTWTSSGSYIDTIPNSGGCDSILLISLVVNTVNTEVIQIGNRLAAYTSDADLYQWIDCNNNNKPISNAFEQSFTPSANGNYAVIILENGCLDTSACYEINILDTDNNSISGTGFTIYPNHSSGIFTLQLKTNEKTMINISSINGQCIFKKEYIQPLDTHEKIDLRSFPSGMYILSVVSNQGMINKKLILK